ncbi:unnamed protein product [Lasius platythorax]|uniref:Uncharacterized protein n=1 Tax=Lasius platythorax TaxID=488582 RepID=A0AAV2NTN7_9HYME
MPVRSDSDDVRGESSKGPSTSRAGRQAVELDFLDSPNPGSKRGITVEDVNRWIKTMSQWRKDIREKEKYPKGRVKETNEGKLSGPETTRKEFVEPLPQRPPKGTPRVVSNVQLVPPRTPKQATPRIKETGRWGNREEHSSSD